MVNWRAFLIISLITGIGGILTVTLVYTLTGGDVPFDYGVVIDAGSSHTQLTAFKWHGEKELGTGLAWQVASCQVDGGLTRNTSPEAAANSLSCCLGNISKSIPDEKHSSTPLVLGATAGMRLLNISKPYQALATLIALRCLLDKSGLAVKHVEIISGEVEGLSAWVTANFLKGIIQNKALEKTTIGAFDLGGASTQFALEVPHDFPNVSTVLLKLYGYQHRVLSRSKLCFGSNEAYRRYTANLVKDLNGTGHIVSPCLPKGFAINHTLEFLFDQPCTKTYATELWLLEHPEMKKKNITFEGSSDGKNCRGNTNALLDEEICKKNYTLCFDIPDVDISQGTFMAFSGFFYTTNFTNSTGSTFKEFKSQTQELCQKTYDEVKVMPTEHPNLLSKYCFQDNLILSILVERYRFNDSTWNNIKFVEKVNCTDVGWSLGYMINATNAIPPELPNPPAIGLPVFILLLVLSVIILSMSIIFFRRTRQSESIVYETI